MFITVPGHQRKKRGRKPLPAELPREEVMHDLPAKEKQCACCGKELPRIGQETMEELAIIPEHVKVIRHVRWKYGPCGCDPSQEAETPEVKIASAPVRLIPHSRVSPRLSCAWRVQNWRTEKSRPLISCANAKDASNRFWSDTCAGWRRKRRKYPPESLIGKAIRHSLRNWEKLIRYLEAWYITPDNNSAENAIRPCVLGRKNWLFANTPRGACASASLYSLMESAKVNGLEPHHSLKYLFTHLPMACTSDALGPLLPTHVKPEYL
jgi:transposase